LLSDDFDQTILAHKKDKWKSSKRRNVSFFYFWEEGFLGDKGREMFKRFSKSAIPFGYICIMKALVVTPKNDNEYKFVSELLKKLGIGLSALSQEELEDLGLSKLMHSVDRTKKVSRSEIMKKLSGDES